MANLGIGVIARYGNFFRGDDDFFTHCLILKNGECWLLGQGLEQVTIRVFRAHASKFKKLEAALASIPPGWAKASYGGYNFITDAQSAITDAQSATASEIAVYGEMGGSLAGYYVPPSGSPLRPWSRKSPISTEFCARKFRESRLREMLSRHPQRWPQQMDSTRHGQFWGADFAAVAAAYIP